ncbi:MAG: hypothetical protein JSW10_03450 [Pseudomonadota bacterium]|nr:MAG: hypothetical protein JSW10_03450 [Pseudomonadota bacterium]
MSNQDMQRELDELRKEVAALSKARKQREPEPPPEEEEAPVTAEPGADENAIKGQVEELLKLLQDEIRDMPAITTMAVFALGILMGRYMR